MLWDVWRIGVIAGVLAACVSGVSLATEKATPADAIAEKFAQADKPKPTPAVAATPERPSLDYEMDMLRDARAEAEARKTAEPAKVAAPEAQAPLAPRVTIESAAPVEVAPEPAVIPAATSLPPTSPEAETVRAAPPSLATAAEEAPLPPKAAPPVSPSNAARATILLVLDGRHTIATPDPIVCLGDVCAISAGLSETARTMPRAEALALKTSRDATSDPCFGKSGCVFRDVALTDDAILQVVSIGTDPAPKPGDGFSASLNSTCKMVDGDLECGQPLATLNFTAWVVPEATAKSAGAAALESAVADGLPFSDEIQSVDK